MMRMVQLRRGAAWPAVKALASLDDERLLLVRLKEPGRHSRLQGDAFREQSREEGRLGIAVPARMGRRG